MEDEDSDVRVSAVAALGQLQGEAAVPGLLQALEDENRNVRVRAAEALGQLQGEAAVPRLWQQHQQVPENYLKEVIQSLQDNCKIYNPEINQEVLPMPEEPKPSVTFNISGGTQGDIVAGNKETNVDGTYIERQVNYGSSSDTEALAQELDASLQDLAADLSDSDASKAALQELEKKTRP